MNAKSTTGRDFMAGLAAAGADKEKIMTLLNDTLEQNNPAKTPVNKDKLMSNVSDNKLVANIKARKAEISAVTGKYMFAEDYVYLAMDAYEKNGLGDAKDFRRDFINKPKETDVQTSEFSKIAAMRQRIGAGQAL